MKVKRPIPNAGPQAKYMVPVVISTFKILEELAKGGALGLNDTAVRTGVSKSTVFRILTTLTHLGYVVRDADRNYFVSVRVGELVSETSSVESLRKMALPHMIRLRDQFGETVNLGRLQMDKVVYVEVVPSEFALRLHEKPGATVDIHATALGKSILAFSGQEKVESLLRGRKLQMYTRNTITDFDAMLAELRRVRDRGYAFDRGEESVLASCVGAPILDGRGNALAALSISGPSSRFNPKQNSAAAEALMKACDQISHEFREGIEDEEEAAPAPKVRKR
jgi:IclR family acetate operon transcriptional repressor